MASYVPVVKNGANGAIFYVGLIDQSNTKLLKANPTIASGDFKVSIDGGAFANLGTLPAATPASGRSIKITLSQAEVNGDNITVQCVDAAGAEWCDLLINIQTSARQIDDLAFPATTGRSMVVDASGLVDANAVKVGPSGSGTAQTAGDVGVKTGFALTAAYDLAKTAAQAGDAMALTAGERTSTADAILNRDMSVGTDSGSPTVRTMRQALRFLRNKWSISGTTLTVTKEDDTTASWTSTVTGTPGADPITGNDPA